MESFLEDIIISLGKGEDIKISGFGTFKSIHQNARNGRNPKTGEKVKIPARAVPRFKISKKFTEEIR